LFAQSEKCNVGVLPDDIGKFIVKFVLGQSVGSFKQTVIFAEEP